MTRSELKTAKPILFNTEIVRAILNGTKTVTRRVVKPKLPNACGFYVVFDSNKIFEDVYDYDENEAMFESPQARLHIGDILYVRETWGIGNLDYENVTAYIICKASENEEEADGQEIKLPQGRLWGYDKYDLHFLFRTIKKLTEQYNTSFYMW